MDKLKKSIGQVMDYLSKNNYCPSTVSDNRICFERLQRFLEENGMPYSREAAVEWLDSIKEELGGQRQSSFSFALIRLNDVMTDGEISIEHDTRHLRSYTALNSYWRSVLDDFLMALEATLSPETIRGYKASCARFLIYVQNKGCSSVSEISYDCIVSFYRDDVHQGKWGKSLINGKVPSMLIYFYKRGELAYGKTRLFHYLSLKRGCYWNNVDKSTHDKIREVIDSEDIASRNVLVCYRDALEKCMYDNEYSKGMRTAYIRAVELLLLFLGMNEYPYSPQIAMLWFEGCRPNFGREDYTIRRALLLVRDYHKTGQFDINAVFNEIPRAFLLIPEWCKEAAYKYESYKIQEGWELSTLNMIRSSLCRFLNFLDEIGMRSYSEITAYHVKQFNENDVHKTASGKNAYNGRIRKFLMFLADEGYLSNRMLFFALPNTGAPNETVVVVLTGAEMDKLNEALYSENSVLSLRKKAMLLLGLKMGMRASDVAKLRYDDIDWEEASIRFIQDKTEVEVQLPMPTDVGNALYRYITNERGRKDSPEIFLGEKAPHRPVGRATCSLALKTALPDRQVKGSGFHVTRKTYATNLLRGGVGAATVADALGQRNTSSVHRYLSLDEDRMRMCAISLAANGIGVWCL